MKTITMLCNLMLVLTLSACASMGSSSDPAKVADGVLTNSNGMTLYTFDKDSEGKSACNGPCAVNWPPFMAANAAPAGTGYSVVVRDDGSKQWAYKGKPLYTWIKDQKAGDKTGDGFNNNVWHVAKP
jgi:predicted lipoprotein with Yx(FWY)xxD motif